ncbi:MAG: RHS repeat-associated core domain-containing protein, partial [Chloroflexota bacterium]
MGSANYAYDGAGNRIQQTVSATVTNYLLDLQPGLATVLQATQGANTTSYVHAPRGIHAQKDASGNWEWMLQDGLGSVRGVADNSANPLESRKYAPYGEPTQLSGTSQTSYGFTGEMTDASGQVYLRARYYNPSIGVFTGLDPFEGMAQRPMSLNGYSWVEGNVINAVDPSGMIYELPNRWSSCAPVFANFDMGLLFGVGAGNGVGVFSPSSAQSSCLDYFNQAMKLRSQGDLGGASTQWAMYKQCQNSQSPTGLPILIPPTNTSFPTEIPITIPPINTPLPTATPTPQATNSSGVSCPYANGQFFNVFGQGIDQRPAILGAGDFRSEARPDHAAVDLVPISAFRIGSNQLTSNNWASGSPAIAQLYAAVNGNLWSYATGLLLENPADSGKYFQYEHAVYNPFNAPLSVCAGDLIGWVSSGSSGEGNEDHVHFAYRNTRAANNAMYYDPRLYFNPPILRSSNEIRNYKVYPIIKTEKVAIYQWVV